MDIGGLVPCSFIDFPKTISAVVFTRGCNLRCPWCHNPDLVRPGAQDQQRWDASTVHGFLDERQGKLGGVVVSGGEPTLQVGLADFCRRLKAQGYRVKLDTNGTRPEVVEQLLGERLIDYVALDVKTDRDGYQSGCCGCAVAAAAIDRSLNLLRRDGVPHEVRTTLSEPLHTIERVRCIADWIQGVSCWILQRFRPGRVLDPDFAGRPPSEDLIAAAHRAGHESGLRTVLR